MTDKIELAKPTYSTRDSFFMRGRIFGLNRTPHGMTADINLLDDDVVYGVRIDSDELALEMRKYLFGKEVFLSGRRDNVLGDDGKWHSRNLLITSCYLEGDRKKRGGLKPIWTATGAAAHAKHEMETHA